MGAAVKRADVGCASATKDIADDEKVRRHPTEEAQTLPIDGPAAPPRKRKRRGWAPDDTDHLAYQWVKFDGKRQGEVARMLGIDQSTVSRIVLRYEKWQAHATPATDGRLSHEERQRAQRWLTYERNERIIASSLRLAADMEQAIDASRSVTSRPNSEPSAERQTRTEYFVIDRTAMASRFLRLAQKINMDNQKLVEKEPLADLPPLEDEDVDEQVAEATAATREVEAAQEAAQAKVNEIMRACDAAEAAVVGKAGVAGPPIRQSSAGPVVEVQVHNLHKMHNCITPETSASVDNDGSCDRKTPREKPAGSPCITADGRDSQRPSPPPAAHVKTQASRSSRPMQKPGTQ
jgi:hypothetical protein